jgi:methenyltetrahydromethanopterin cyclohydrolase
MTDFHRLVEHNDNEGETWLYYFQADNEILSALEVVTSIASEEYEFDSEDVLDEDDVDFLIDQLDGIGNYKPLANKVSIDPAKRDDLLTLASVIDSGELDEEELYEELLELLYKGSLFIR